MELILEANSLNFGNSLIPLLKSLKNQEKTIFENIVHRKKEHTRINARTHKNLEKNSFEILHLNYFHGCPS